MDEMLKIPKYVQDLTDVLEANGYSAYCVGGAVRDILMGINPSDFDVASNCPPEKAEKLFERTVPTGIKHGTITVITEVAPIELTAFRTEEGYRDTRHPDRVKFIGNIEDDLKRRDFTVNAIAYNKKTGIVDLFGGIDDIKNKILRAVGNPEERFKEDALRIMRCFRFAATLDFLVEASTLNCAISTLPLLENISRERIFTELKKMLVGKNLLRAKAFFENGGLEFLGIAPFDCTSLCSVYSSLNVRLSALMLISNSNPEEVLKNLKSDGNTFEQVTLLCKAAKLKIPETKPEIKRMMNKLGGCFYDYAYLTELFGGNPRKLITQYNEIINNREPYRICDLAISGNDLKEKGISGRQLGETLDLLLENVIENPENNKREKLLKLI